MGLWIMDVFSVLQRETCRIGSALTVAALLAAPALAQEASLSDVGSYYDDSHQAGYLGEALETEEGGTIGQSVSESTFEMAAESMVDCDSCEKQLAITKAVASSHKGVFYDNNFDYLCDECYDRHYLGDNLKRKPIFWDGILDIGGQYRYRYHKEQNMRGLGLTGRDDSFSLHRTRLYANAEFGDRFRVYGEMLDAASFGENFGPRPIEENRVDLQNLFVDFKLFDNGDGNLWGRAGRQELLYGAERTISPLDWANTRRTFEGYKLMWKGSDWDIDGFWTRPVPINPDALDGTDQSQEFMGIYSTYKGCENKTLDLYWIRFIEQEGTPFEFDTAGARWAGSMDEWLWETEGNLQWGDYNAEDHLAGSFTLGLGRKFSDVAWTPTLWAYYDWASGDETPGNGYNHLFPLAHKYNGFMDLFGRSNIEDINFLLTAKPTDKLKLLAWWHIFYLQDGDDTAYNVNMSAFAAGNGSQYLGQEIDFIGVYNFHPRMNVLLGYSYFFAGEYYGAGGSTPYSGDADFFYCQFTVNF